jgi:hypothetical protein
MYDLSMEAIRDATVRSLTLGKLLKRHSLPEPKRVRTLFAPKISSDFSQFDEERSQVEDIGPRIRDPQTGVLLPKDGKHLMSMSEAGILRVWDMSEEAIVASVDVMGCPLFWDCLMDVEGLTIIACLGTTDKLVPLPTRSLLILML